MYFFGSPPMSAKKDRKKRTYMSSILMIELIWRPAGKHPSEHCHHWTPLSWPEIKQEPGSGLSSDDPRWTLYLIFVFVISYLSWTDLCTSNDPRCTLYLIFRICSFLFVLSGVMYLQRSRVIFVFTILYLSCLDFDDPRETLNFKPGEY